nr:DUF4143 domain-containing protein [Acidobacteriota bacterium]
LPVRRVPFSLLRNPLSLPGRLKTSRWPHPKPLFLASSLTGANSFPTFYGTVKLLDRESHGVFCLTGSWLEGGNDVAGLSSIVSHIMQFRFLSCVFHIVNLASLSGDVGVSATTLRNWISVLKASYVVFELPPFFENIRRRMVKSPKIYFTDVGLAAFLLGIHTAEQAARDPLRGNLYENLVVADIVKGALNRGTRPELYFFRDSNGAEVDLIIRESGALTPVEIKSAATFTPAFARVLERFPLFGARGSRPGVVLYNGGQRFEVRGIRAFNPLEADDLWAELTICR